MHSCSLQATLATYGIHTQTPKQVEPIQIWPPSELVKVGLSMYLRRYWTFAAPV